MGLALTRSFAVRLVSRAMPRWLAILLSVMLLGILVVLLLAYIFPVQFQQPGGNVLTPRIQGNAVQVHAILIFVTVVAGGAIGGIPGVIFAVPAVAVLRVLWVSARREIRDVADSRIKSFRRVLRREFLGKVTDLLGLPVVFQRDRDG